MKVLISDNLGEAGIKMFEEEPGIDVDVNTGLEPDELKKIIGDYDALVIRSATKVPLICCRLRKISRLWVGRVSVLIMSIYRKRPNMELL